ncbi:hypothetical protein ACG3RN_26095 [Pseudomonas aeruginosa]
MASADRVIDQLEGELEGSAWFTPDYVRQVIVNAAQAFSGALERWRVLFDATRQQMDMADRIVKSHTASHTERQNAHAATATPRASTPYCSNPATARTMTSIPIATWPAKASCQATTSRACR